MITNGRICKNQKKIYTTVSINQIRKEMAMKAKNLIRTLSALVLAIGMLFHTTGIRVNAAPGFTVTNTATIQTSQANDYSSQIQFNIHAEVTGQVHAGDTIRYDFENININPLNGLDVTTTDATGTKKVIGKLSVHYEDHYVDTFSDVINPTYDNEYTENTYLTVTFNGEYDEVNFDIGGNVRSNHFIKNQAYNRIAKILYDGTELASNSHNVPGRTFQNKVPTFLVLDGTINLETNSSDEIRAATLTPSGYSSGSNNPDSAPLKPGDVLTYELTDGKVEFDTTRIAVGTEVNPQNFRFMTADTAATRANGNGVVFFPKRRVKTKILSIEPTKVVVQIISMDDENIAAQYRLGPDLPLIVKDTSTVTNNTLPVALKSQINNEAPKTSQHNLTVNGGTLSSNARRAPRGNVVAKYLDQAGNELAPQETVVTNGLENAAYTATEKTIAGYELVETPANVTGKVIGNTTIEVIFVYRQLKTFEVKKVWADPIHMLDEVTLHVLANGIETGSPIVLNATNNWKETVTMPVTDMQGNVINYSVTEDTYTNYTASVEGNLTDGFTVTNTYVPTPTPVPVQPTPAPSKPTPKTSDATNVMMYGAVGIGAFCIAALIFIRKFKQSK